MKTTAARAPYKKSAATKQAIFDSAMELMKEKGYRGTTIREICRKAGTAVGSFYSYFDGKADILKPLYAAGDAYFTAAAADSTGEDLAENIRVFFRHYARLNLDTGVETLRIMFTPDNEWFGRRKVMQEVLERILADGRARGLLRPELEPARLVDNLFLTMRGICYDWCSRGGAYDLEARMMECLDLLLPGLLTQPG